MPTLTTGAFSFNFYEPQYQPTGLTGLVGGAISSELLDPRLGSFIADMTVPDITTLYQFRKLYVKQIEAGTYQDVKVSLANVEHSDQISFFIDSGLSGNYDTATNALAYPSGVDLVAGTLSGENFSGNYNTPIYYTGSVGGATTVSGEYFPVWIRQEIDKNEGNDSLASFIVQVSATKLT